MPGAIRDRQLPEPRSLSDALRMMRREGPLVPMAGCTDLYVSLQFGTLRATRFLNLWPLDELRGEQRDRLVTGARRDRAPGGAGWRCRTGGARTPQTPAPT